RREMFDVILTGRVEPEEFLCRASAASIPGLEFLAAEEIDLRAESVESSATASRFRVTLDLARLGLTRGGIEDSLARLSLAEHFPVDVKKKQEIKRIDLKDSLLAIESAGPIAGSMDLFVTVRHAEGLFVQPHVALGFILGCPLELGNGVRAERERVIAQRELAAAV
ncbi:DUF2344 domain-containing protein, partial [Candidatus Sumerlaeota bacterium]|nr:DUF2344 domain-containing protein [Candidatus Sumerlaeota bacterium]